MAARKSKPRRKAAPDEGAATASSPTLAYHYAEKLALHRLPFVGRKHRGIASFWSVPSTGGYGGGCETGAAMASAYLAHLSTDRVPGGLLQCVVLDMLATHENAATDEQRLSVEGQIVGFCSEVCAAIQRFAPLLGFRADTYQERYLLVRANAGLEGHSALSRSTFSEASNG